ncbi:hypothetical protein PGB90_007452 [Kerria lacca]
MEPLIHEDLLPTIAEVPLHLCCGLCCAVSGLLVQQQPLLLSSLNPLYATSPSINQFLTSTTFKT